MGNTCERDDNMTWKDNIRKNDMTDNELDDIARQLWKYANTEFNLSDKQFRTVLKIILQDVEINIGERQMELDADRAHMRSMERL